MDIMKSYKDAEKIWATCRNKRKGKPLPANWRMFKEKSTFMICMPHWAHGFHYEPVASITPNNRLTMLLPKEELLRNSNSIVMALHAMTPFMVQRFGKGHYRIGAHSKYPSHPSLHRHYLTINKANSQQYYKGIKFDLVSGVCINPEPDESVEPVPERRKVWLRDLKQFKRGLKTRAKVGALTMHIQKVNEMRMENAKLQWSERTPMVVDWDTAKELRKKLVRCMKKEVYSEDILMAFVQSVSPDPYWSSSHALVDQKDVLSVIDTVFNRYSQILRREYGVFGKTLHKKN